MRTHKLRLTGANRGNGDRKENLRSLRFLLLKFLRVVIGEEEVSRFSDAITGNCAPLV